MTTEHDGRQYPIYLFAFRFRESHTGKWRKARHRAEIDDIRKQFAEFELEGEPIVITGDGGVTFNPFCETDDA
jgi:hypothetical protein